MPLTAPNLDDMTFDQLVGEARAVITRSSPDWNDLSEGDPGIALMEAFAYLADTTIYRLNRVPDKLYVEFLRLIGVRVQPPSAAVATLTFTRQPTAPAGRIQIPRGTRVTLGTPVSGSEPPVFGTVALVRMEPGDNAVNVHAICADLVEGELLGVASGQPALSFTVQRPPIIAPTGDSLDLLVGVEALPGELGETETAIEFGGKSYRVWEEVDTFSNLGPDDPAYIADRSEGRILLAPAVRTLQSNGTLSDAPRALAAAPSPGREIRAWYRTGGGPAGNVAAGVLTSLKQGPAGVTVTNAAAATGGRAAEMLADALVRGPQEMLSLSRAVTARDYQLVAEQSSGAVARARAFTQAALWKYATAGTVEVVLVPQLQDASLAASVTADQLHSLETADGLSQVQAALDDRRPLGTSCVVNWANYKTMRVKATIVVQREEDVQGVQQRVDERLHLTVNPLPTERSAGGWPFGQALYASNVFKIVLAEPGVRYARGVRITVDDVPDQQISTLEADQAQPSTWYAGSGDTLFRTLNDGDGWEPMGRFPGEVVEVARVHPEIPGLLAVATTLASGSGSVIYFSRDSGETWTPPKPFGPHIRDVAWVTRDEGPVLLLATGDVIEDQPDGGGGGLFQLDLAPDAAPVQVIVDPANQNMPFYAVVSVREVRGEVTVAVAAQGSAGVYLSNDAGRGGTFRPIGLAQTDVRVLAVQHDGPRSWLWAGTASPGGESNGKGCFRRELLGREDPPGWDDYGDVHGWNTGTCWSLAFAGSRVLAGTYQAGVMDLDTSAANAQWLRPNLETSGLPVRDRDQEGHFQQVNAVAVNPSATRLLAGGPLGVYRSVAIGDGQDIPTNVPVGGLTYESCKEHDFTEEVTLPPTWLFVCGANELEVVADASA